MKKYNIAFILFSVLVCMSCKNKTREVIIYEPKEISSVLPDSHPEKYMRSNSVYATELLNDSSFVCLYVLPENKQTYFFSDTLNQLYVSKCKLTWNGLDTMRTKLIRECNRTYLTVDSLSFKNVEIDQIPFLYFSFKEAYMGKAVSEQTVTFCLVSLKDLSEYKLVYIGEPTFKCENCIDGDFIENAKLDKHSAMSKKLTELSKSSTLIYQRTMKDDNIYYRMNYEVKWNTDNNMNNSYGAGRSEIELPIRSTLYRSDLFALNRGSVNDSISNDSYTFVNYFRGNVIGYNKMTKMYFPLFIESCRNFCNKKISFIGSDSLKIIYDEDNDHEYIIPINDVIFDELIGD